MFDALNSSYRSCSSTSATAVIGGHTAAKYGTKPPRYVLRPSTFEIVAVQLCSVTETAPKTTFLCVNRSSIRCDFLGGAQASGVL